MSLTSEELVNIFNMLSSEEEKKMIIGFKAKDFRSMLEIKEPNKETFILDVKYMLHMFLFGDSKVSKIKATVQNEAWAIIEPIIKKYEVVDDVPKTRGSYNVVTLSRVCKAFPEIAASILQKKEERFPSIKSELPKFLRFSAGAALIPRNDPELMEMHRDFCNELDYLLNRSEVIEKSLFCSTEINSGIFSDDDRITMLTMMGYYENEEESVVSETVTTADATKETNINEEIEAILSEEWKKMFRGFNEKDFKSMLESKEPNKETFILDVKYMLHMFLFGDSKVSKIKAKVQKKAWEIIGPILKKYNVVDYVPKTRGSYNVVTLSRVCDTFPETAASILQKKDERFPSIKSQLPKYLRFSAGAALIPRNDPELMEMHRDFCNKLDHLLHRSRLRGASTYRSNELFWLAKNDSELFSDDDRIAMLTRMGYCKNEEESEVSETVITADATNKNTSKEKGCSKSTNEPRPKRRAPKRTISPVSDGSQPKRGQ